MTTWHLILLAFLGIAAGFCNTVAGGGSILVVPLMIFLGLPATIANASLRPAILVQNVFAVFGFRSAGLIDRSFLASLWPRALVTILFACLGATLASSFVRDSQLEKILGAAFLGLFVMMVFRKAKPSFDSKPTKGLLLMAGAGFYGGFIQVGVGFLLTTALLVGSTWELPRVHAAKICIVGIYTVFALMIFSAQGQVDWLVAGSLACGQGLGGYLGSRFASQTSPNLLKRIYLFLMVIFAVILIFRSW